MLRKGVFYIKDQAIWARKETALSVGSHIHNNNIEITHGVRPLFPGVFP